MKILLVLIGGIAFLDFFCFLFPSVSVSLALTLLGSDFLFNCINMDQIEKYRNWNQTITSATFVLILSFSEGSSKL